MNADLKRSLEKLADALHRAIEESPDVEGALTHIKEEGFQAFLLLEVTVALGEPSSGLSLSDVAHALAEDDDVEDADVVEDGSDDDEEDGDDASEDAGDPDAYDAAEEEAGIELATPVGDDADADASAVEGGSGRDEVRIEATIKSRRILQLPVLIPSEDVGGDTAISADGNEGELGALIAPADLDFLKAMRIRLD